MGYWLLAGVASRAELEGFNVDAVQKKLRWFEATEQSANMMAMTWKSGIQKQILFDAPAAT